jgi:hypothetical protein
MEMDLFVVSLSKESEVSMVRQAHHERKKLTTNGENSPRKGRTHHERKELTMKGERRFAFSRWIKITL